MKEVEFKEVVDFMFCYAIDDWHDLMEDMDGDSALFFFTLNDKKYKPNIVGLEYQLKELRREEVTDIISESWHYNNINTLLEFDLISEVK